MPHLSDLLHGPHDVLIIGSGAAALALARALASSLRVLVIAPDGGTESASRMAQGGIAAALLPEDCPDRHAEDTERCGAHAGDPATIRSLCEDAPRVLGVLARSGMAFDRTDSQLDLAHEGGHRYRRVVHVGDRTGAALMNFLTSDARKRSNILQAGGLRAVALLREPETGRCIGARVADLARNRLLDLHARATVLACGGCSAIYPHSTGPRSALGDGLRLALDAGATVRNLAFIQFHPTAMPHASGVALLTEALRGEGATLRCCTGQPLMEHHPNGDLAPRDVVARAVHDHLLSHGTPARLDLRTIRIGDPAGRFPAAWETITCAGLDPSLHSIPVVAAAHYQCGGVVIDLDGRTACPGLFAVGEVACSGLHGANRLASNSLMEALVLAPRVAHAIGSLIAGPASGSGSLPPRDAAHAPPDRSACLAAQNILHQVRQLAGSALALSRNALDLRRAVGTLEQLRSRSSALAAQWPVAPEVLDAAAASTAALLIARDALARGDSLGAHFRSDAPDRSTPAAS